MPKDVFFAKASFATRYRGLLAEEGDHKMDILKLYSIYSDALRKVSTSAKAKVALSSDLSLKEILRRPGDLRALQEGLAESMEEASAEISESIPDSLLLLLMSISRWIPAEVAGLDKEDHLEKRLDEVANRLNYPRLWKWMNQQVNINEIVMGDLATGSRMLEMDNSSVAFGAFAEARRRGEEPSSEVKDNLIAALNELGVSAKKGMSTATLEALVNEHIGNFDLARAGIQDEVRASLRSNLERLIPGNLLDEIKAFDGTKDPELKEEMNRFIETYELIEMDREAESKELTEIDRQLLMKVFMKLLLRFRNIFKKNVVRKGKFKKDPFCFETTVYGGFNNFTPLRQAAFFVIWKAMLLARAIDLYKEASPNGLEEELVNLEEDTEANETFKKLSAKLLEPPKGLKFIQLGSGPLAKLKGPNLIVDDIIVEPQIGEAIGPVSLDQLGAVTIALTCPSMKMGEGEILKTFIKLEINRFDGELYLYGMPGLTLKEVLKAYDAGPDYELLKAHIYKGLWQSVCKEEIKEVDPLLVTKADKTAQAVQAKLGVPTYTGDEYQASFEKSWQTLAQGQPGLCRRAYEVIATFKENPNHPSLRTHKLSGGMEDVWSISINMAYRIIFKRGTEGKLSFIDVGTHEVYRT